MDGIDFDGNEVMSDDDDGGADEDNQGDLDDYGDEQDMVADGLITNSVDGTKKRTKGINGGIWDDAGDKEAAGDEDEDEKRAEDGEDGEEDAESSEAQSSSASSSNSNGSSSSS